MVTMKKLGLGVGLLALAGCKSGEDVSFDKGRKTRLAVESDLLTPNDYTLSAVCEGLDNGDWDFGYKVAHKGVDDVLYLTTDCNREDESVAGNWDTLEKVQDSYKRGVAANMNKIVADFNLSKDHGQPLREATVADLNTPFDSILYENCGSLDNGEMDFGYRVVEQGSELVLSWSLMCNEQDDNRVDADFLGIRSQVFLALDDHVAKKAKLVASDYDSGRAGIRRGH
jgi:hypothetical protein